MVRKIHLIFAIFSIFQCGIVVSADSTTNNPPIPLSELCNELREELLYERAQHIHYMLLVQSYGDRVYDLSKNLSTDCSTTIRATRLMYETLALCEDVDNAMFSAAITVEAEICVDKDEHPLELVCAKITKLYAAQANLTAAFEKARIQVTKLDGAGSRPPYYRELLKPRSLDSIRLEMVNKLAIPEFARLMAVKSFVRHLTSPDDINGVSAPRHYLAKSCQILAKQEKFAESMQSIFMKAMNDTVAEIGVDDRLERRKAAGDLVGHFWVPNEMKTLYSYVARDPILKKELDNVAASLGKGASTEEYDFSKL